MAILQLSVSDGFKQEVKRLAKAQNCGGGMSGVIKRAVQHYSWVLQRDGTMPVIKQPFAEPVEPVMTPSVVKTTPPFPIPSHYNQPNKSAQHKAQSADVDAHFKEVLKDIGLDQQWRSQPPPAPSDSYEIDLAFLRKANPGYISYLDTAGFNEDSRRRMVIDRAKYERSFQQ